MNEPTNESENGAVKAVENNGENGAETQAQNGTGDPNNLARWFKDYEQPGILKSEPTKARESKPKPASAPPINKADWKCVHCGNTVPEDFDYTGEYCSVNCQYLHRPDLIETAMQHNGLRKCKACGKFVKGRSWCSPECKAEINRQSVKASREKLRAAEPPNPCAVCGQPSRTKYCSDSCRAVGHHRNVKAYKTRVREQRGGGLVYSDSDQINRVKSLLSELKGMMAQIEARALKTIGESIQPPIPNTDSQT